MGKEWVWEVAHKCKEILWKRIRKEFSYRSQLELRKCHSVASMKE